MTAVRGDGAAENHVPVSFRSGLIDDWYDGAIHGFALCEATETAYACAMVACDANVRTRCFLCAAIPRRIYANLERCFDDFDVERRPWRSLPILHRPQEQRYGRLVAQALRETLSPYFVGITHQLGDGWLSVRPAGPDMAERLVFEDLLQICTLEPEERRQFWFPLAGGCD